MPSPYVVVVIGLGDPIEVAASSDSTSDSRSLRSLPTALRTGPRELAHGGRAFDISIEMTPAGALRLLGLAGSLLSDRVVEPGGSVGGKCRRVDRPGVGGGRLAAFRSC